MHALKQLYLAPARTPPDNEVQAKPANEAQALGKAQAPAQTAALDVRGRRIRRAVQAHALTTVLWTLSLALLLGVWYVGTKYKLEFYIRFTNIPTPAEVLQKLIEVNQSPKFMTNIGISLRRILIGFGIATLIGVPLGLLIGRYKPVRDLLLPICEVLRPIPAIAWVPMSIMLWPNNEASIVYITFLGSFFPILLNTIHGVQSI
ncbi:MAG TPA: ABC transporter permease subunit, partial [Burkholderiales bacterium]|nr:ABC transporter permease subunit [Burkholderiales bacterium]